MTRKEAKELLPVIQAFAEGKTIEVRVGNDSWVKTDEVYGGRNNDCCYFAVNVYWGFDTLFKTKTFIDGTPFGIKE